MNGDEESILETYGRAIVPALRRPGRWGDGPDQPSEESPRCERVTNGDRHGEDRSSPTSSSTADHRRSDETSARCGCRRDDRRGGPPPGAIDVRPMELPSGAFAKTPSRPATAAASAGRPRSSASRSNRAGSRRRLDLAPRPRATRSPTTGSMIMSVNDDTFRMDARRRGRPGLQAVHRLPRRVRR
jgi:hypothetical protein